MMRALPFLTVSAVLCACSTYAQTLNVGDPAPGFKVGKWVKGEHVEAISKGKVYVIEFWATRCPPCVAGIPHLSALAKRYKGKATVIGVSILHWQDGSSNDDLQLVSKFMKTSNGQGMKYDVAVDTPDAYMVKRWLGAAGFDSIPCAFVVGKDRRMAWMGDPSGLDSVLARVTQPQ